jgi:hypothetical protein
MGYPSIDQGGQSSAKMEAVVGKVGKGGAAASPWLLSSRGVRGAVGTWW